DGGRDELDDVAVDNV
ncbi:unnamed protein product, partial [Adineta steineri]